MEPHGVALVSRERLERPYGMRFWIANSNDQERQCSAVQESLASRLGACARV